MFFKGMYVERKTQDQVALGHCCASTLGPTTNRVDFYHYPQFMQSRQSWSENQVAGCDVCWHPESNGQHSFRRGYVDWMRKWSAGHDAQEPALWKLDYNVGPVCNAKCIHCSSAFSSLWRAEDERYGERSWIDFGDVAKNDVTHDIDVSQLRVLYINGGEPFLSPDSQRLLERVREHGDISRLTFQTNTNGSIRPGPEIIRLWRQCKSVDIFVSLDATDRAFNYVRYPLDWSQVVDNMRFMSEIDSRIRVKISISLGAHTIDELEMTWQWFLCNRERFNMDETAFGVHRCYGHLDPAQASADLKDIWLQDLEGTRWYPEAETMLSSPMPQKPQAWQDWLIRLDHRRGSYWPDHLPRLHSSYKKSLLV